LDYAHIKLFHTASFVSALKFAAENLTALENALKFAAENLTALENALKFAAENLTALEDGAYQERLATSISLRIIFNSLESKVAANRAWECPAIRNFSSAFCAV
jgi:hypothetical protein